VNALKLAPHEKPPAHAFPHEPQWLGSLLVSMHTPLQHATGQVWLVAQFPAPSHCV